MNQKIQNGPIVCIRQVRQMFLSALYRLREQKKQKINEQERWGKRKKLALFVFGYIIKLEEISI